MGLRSFAAGRLADLLVDRRELDDRVRALAEKQCRGPTSVDLRTHLAGSRHRIHELRLHPHHGIVLWVASLVVARQLRKEGERRRKRRRLASPSVREVSTSTRSERVAERVDATVLFLSRVAACLAFFLVLSYLADEEARRRATSTRELMEKYLFVSSLWLALISAMLMMASSLWGVLDPRNGNGISPRNGDSGCCGSSNISKGRTWRDEFATARAEAETAPIIVSVAAILYLAHVQLPLFRHALRGEVDLGLTPALSHVLSALNQFLCSFLGFCAYSKLRPQTPEASMPEGMRKARRHVADPALVLRMSALASEAMEKVQARNKRGRRLSRTYSEGNLMHISPPSPSTSGEHLARGGSGGLTGRRHGALSPLPELDDREEKNEEGKVEEEEEEVERSPRDTRWPNLSPQTLSSSELQVIPKDAWSVGKGIERNASARCTAHLMVPRHGYGEMAYSSINATARLPTLTDEEVAY